MSTLCIRYTRHSTQICTRRYGLDLIKGELRNNMKHGVLEPAMSKIKAFKAATEAAISILRIDDMIKMDPPPAQDDPHAGH